MWAEETGALCLRWMDPDSSVSVKTSVWTEWIPFVDLFLNFYLCSASLSLSELVSYNPSLPLLQSFFFHSCNKAAVNLTTFLSLFFNLQYSFALLCIFFSLPLKLCRGHRDTVGRQRVRLQWWKKRQLAGCITCCLDSKRYDSAASTQLQCKPLHI